MRWTESEVEILKKEYPRVPTRFLSGKLDRSIESIQKKAQRLGIQKRDNHRLLCRIETGDEIEVENEEFAHYIRGLVDGEGTFTTKGDDGFRFGIEMTAENREMLEDVQSFFGAGTVHEYDGREDNYKDTVKYTVQSVSELVNRVIPFFEEYPPIAREKREQYNTWRRSVLGSLHNTETFKL